MSIQLKNTLDSELGTLYTYQAKKETVADIAGVKVVGREQSVWLSTTQPLPSEALSSQEFLDQLFTLPTREKTTKNGHTIKVVLL